MKLKLFKYRSRPGEYGIIHAAIGIGTPQKGEQGRSKSGRNIIIIGKYHDKDLIRGICVLDNGSRWDSVGKLTNWTSHLFDEIDSVTIKGLSKSSKKFKRSINGWITVGEYLICDDEIVKLDEFLEEYDIPITELGLNPINNLILRIKDCVGE